jgi:hypothetical protein
MKATGCVKSSRWTLLAVLLGAFPWASSMASVLFEVEDATWKMGASGSTEYAANFSQTPMTKSDTYYIQFTVELTSTLGPGTHNYNNYPYVSPSANVPEGGAAFVFYVGDNYNDANLFKAGFSTSTFSSNKFVAFSGNTRTNFLTDPGDPNSTITAQLSTSEYGVVKYQFDVTLRLGSTFGGSSYDITLTQLDGAGNAVLSSTLSNLALVGSNYFDNNSPNKTFSKLQFQSSTSTMTAHFDNIIVSTGPIPVPEPGAVALVGLGMALLGISRRRRKA